MSNVSSIHSITKFVAGKSEPLSGQVLVKVGYKPTKNKKTGEKIPAKYPSICVSVPPIEFDTKDEIQLSRILKLVKGQFGEIRREIVKSLYENSNGALSSVSTNEVSVNACLAFAESQVGRLSKDSIGKWFDSSCEEFLTLSIATQLGFDELNADQLKTVKSRVSAWRDWFTSLTGTFSPTEPQIRTAKTIIANSEDSDSEFAEKLLAKIAEFEKPVEKDVLLLNL